MENTVKLGSNDHGYNEQQLTLGLGQHLLPMKFHAYSKQQCLNSLL